MYQGRARISQIGACTQIVISARKNYFLIVVWSLFLVVWSLGEILIIWLLVKGPDRSLGFPSVWTLFGALFLWSLAEVLIGKEIIEASPAKMRIQNTVGRFSTSKDYPSNQIENLRLNTKPPFFPFKTTTDSILGKRMLAFDIGEDTVQFARGINEAEAKYILEVLKKVGIKTSDPP